MFRIQLLILVLSILLVACKTLDTDAGDSVSANAYNRAITEQGFEHYCGGGKCDSTPELVSATAPKYPSVALHAGQNGQVSVVFDIEEDGSVANARLEAASSPEFGQAALQAVQSWRYKPATLNDKPVKFGPMRQTIPFELR